MAADELPFVRDLRERLRHMKSPEALYHGTPPVYVPHELEDADYVWIRKDGKRGPLDPNYDGPFVVVNRTPKYFEIDLGNRVDRVTVDRLKAARGATPADVPVPVRRGRPPARRDPESRQGFGADARVEVA